MSRKEIVVKPYKQPFIPHQPFRYFGSDANLVPTILKLIPRTEVFAELFGGSGVVSLTIAKYGLFRKIILNDLDKRIYAAHYLLKTINEKPEYATALYNLYKWLHDISPIPQPKYIELKKIFSNLIERWRRMDFNLIETLGMYSIFLLTGMINSESTGLYHYFTKIDNVYHVCSSRRYLSGPKTWLELGKLYRSITLYNCDAIELLEKLDKDDVVIYLDPPHLVKGESAYTLGWNIRKAYHLAKTLASMKKAKILLKLSEFDRIYSDFLDDWNVLAIRYLSQIDKSKSWKRYFFLKNY